MNGKYYIGHNWIINMDRVVGALLKPDSFVRGRHTEFADMVYVFFDSIEEIALQDEAARDFWKFYSALADKEKE